MGRDKIGQKTAAFHYKLYGYMCAYREYVYVKCTDYFDNSKNEPEQDVEKIS